jgi:hypothetical protein
MKNINCKGVYGEDDWLLFKTTFIIAAGLSCGAGLGVGLYKRLVRNNKQNNVSKSACSDKLCQKEQCDCR